MTDEMKMEKDVQEFEAALKSELERLANLVGGKPWGADKGKPRIYMPSRKDIKAYFEFERPETSPMICTEDPLGGAALKIYIDDCGQAPNWYKSQKAKVMARLAAASLALAAIRAGDEELALDLIDREEMEAEDMTAEQIDEAASHMLNGRLAEAREVLGLTEYVRSED